MKYNLLKHSSRHSTTLSCNITSQHNTPHSFSHHSRTQGSKHNITKSINTQALCKRYTKSQSYMQCGTLSVKNLVGHTWVHDKTDHTRVGWATLTSWNHKESYYFVRMLQPSGIDTSLKEHSHNSLPTKA